MAEEDRFFLGTLSAGGQLQKRGKGNSLGWRVTSEVGDPFNF